ncbi:MAG TPA: D-alanine--D-alanine ligase family protein [Clostridia bacterium]|nr:D-alanine--D-alanine ligase family protein [Clostridia bacterium]
MGGKLNVAVVFGGKSGEHEVSLMSATNVIKAMDKNKYDIHMIGITREGKWLAYKGDADRIADSSWEKEAARADRDETINLLFSGLFGGNNESKIDVVFPVLHGPNGEDGTIQGLFEMLDMPYVGCGVMASALGMDKEFSKQLFKDAGLPVGKYAVVLKRDIERDMEPIIGMVEKEFAFPVFIKPVNMGSSVGITKAHTREELKYGLTEACKYDRKVIIEKGINCREFECSVLGNNDPVASGIGEIIPSHEFYDYEAKYFDDGKSVLVIPAELPENKIQEFREAAVKAYKALDCCGMARVDFFMDRETEKIYINEINTIPGFTKISMYPKLWDAAGLSYGKLIDRLIELAIDRYNE